MSKQLACNSADRRDSTCLRISLFGAPEVLWDGQSLAVLRRQPRALLYRLAAQSQPLSRAELAFLFYADEPEAIARRKLSSILADLRRVLPDIQFVQANQETVSLDWARSYSDATAFQTSITNSKRGDAIALCHQAVQLVDGPFLAGFSLSGHPEFEDWAAVERSTLERLCLEALATLADERALCGDYRSAIEYVRRYLATDELAEEMYRRLIALCALSGDRALAVREFEQCATVLKRELNLSPSTETNAVYQAVLDGRSPSELASMASIRRAAEPVVYLNSRPRHNLPAPVTSFIGRESEIAHLRPLLDPIHGPVRLVTCTGAGGSGKTRLALEVARALLSEYPAGIWWVDLTSISDAELVPHAVASVLGVQKQNDRPLVETLQDILRERRLLLVLDNCEHLLDTCAQLASKLLAACPDLCLLATSRQALGIAGETIYPLPGLSLPPVQGPLSIAQVEHSQAVQLFLARATAVRLNLALTNENVDAITRICRGLDGLPLALELAAARLKVLTVQEIAARLDERFRLLTGVPLSSLSHHETLQAAMDWSYYLLPDSERALLRQLSVFHGGWSLAAVEAISTEQDESVLDLLMRLIDKSLVVMHIEGEQARYRLLETIRQYAWERLQEAGEAKAVQEWHARYFVKLCEQVDHRDNERAKRLEVEIANQRAALTWLYQAAGTHSPNAEYRELLLRLTVSFIAYCYRYTLVSEAREWIERVLQLTANSRRRERAELLRYAGLFYFNSDLALARAYLEESITVFRELDAWQDLALALSNLSMVVNLQVGPAAAAPFAEQGLTLGRASNDKLVLLQVLYNIGQLMDNSVDDPRCRAIWEEYLDVARELKDQCRIGFGLVRLAVQVEYWEGLYSSAWKHLAEGAAIGEYGVIERECLSQVLLAQGNCRLARQLADEALAMSRELGYTAWVTEMLSFLARIAYYQGDVPAAVEWAREAHTLGRKMTSQGSDWGLALALPARGWTLTLTQPEQARSDLVASLRLLSAWGRKGYTIWPLYSLSWLAVQRQDPEALAFAQQLLEICETGNVPHGVGWSYLVQGEWARQSGDYVQAESWYEQAGQVFQALGALGDLGLLRHKQGWLAQEQDDPARAGLLWADSLALAREGDSWACLSANLHSLAGLAMRLEQLEWAAWLTAAAAAQPVALVWSLPMEAEHYNRERLDLYKRLGDKAWTAASTRAQAMQAEEVDALAQRVARLAARRSFARKQSNAITMHRPATPLSAREIQVLDLVAQGLSDAKIGERLVISPRTVTTHLTSIYRKLGTNSRSEAAAIAADLALL